MKWVKWIWNQANDEALRIPHMQIQCPRCHRTLKVDIGPRTTLNQFRAVRDHALKAHKCQQKGIALT